MQYIDRATIEANFDYGAFISFLGTFLQQPFTAPDRAHHQIPVPAKREATLLLMPAWSVGRYIGVKLVNVFPDNVEVPTINGQYVLMDGTNGQVRCTLDGLALTTKRTAAVSGLASSLLVANPIQSMLMIGTGNLCHELIKAHAAVHPIKKVWIWGRNFEKAKHKATTLALSGVACEAVPEKNAVMGMADLISCATLSESPLVFGKHLKTGYYLDLVGSFKPHMREADNDCLLDANIFADTYHATTESGDLFIPLEQGVIQRIDIMADLPEVCAGKQLASVKGKGTVFKSVGFAAPDLAAAIYLYEKLSS